MYLYGKLYRLHNDICTVLCQLAILLNYWNQTVDSSTWTAYSDAYGIHEKYGFNFWFKNNLHKWQFFLTKQKNETNKQTLHNNAWNTYPNVYCPHRHSIDVATVACGLYSMQTEEEIKEEKRFNFFRKKTHYYSKIYILLFVWIYLFISVSLHESHNAISLINPEREKNRSHSKNTKTKHFIVCRNNHIKIGN